MNRDDCIGSVLVEFQFETKSYVLVFPCVCCGLNLSLV